MHSNVGLFLDQQKINKPADFLAWPREKKLPFINSLRTIIWARNTRLQHDLSGTLGLKLHFHVCRHPRKGWLNLPNSTFARKVAFFSTKTIVSFPFDEIDWTREDDLLALFSLLCDIKPFMNAGLIEIADFPNDVRGAQVHRFNKKHKLIAANFELTNLERQFEEPYYETPVINLYLPYFRQLSPVEIISIRKREKDRYFRLEQALESLLTGRTQIQSEEKLLDTLEEIDQHISDLENRYKEILRAEGRKDFYTLIGLIGIGVVALSNPPAALAAALAPRPESFPSESIIRYVTRKLTKEAFDSLEKDKYYLLWRLHSHESKFRCF